MYPSVPRTDFLSSGRHTTHHCGSGSLASLGSALAWPLGELLTFFVLCLPGSDFLIILTLVHLWVIPVCVLLGSNIIMQMLTEAVEKSLPPWFPNPPLFCGCLHLPPTHVWLSCFNPWGVHQQSHILRRYSPSSPPPNEPTHT